MARMIPARCHNDAPGSEKKIFDLIYRDPGAADWVVLHSLGMADRGHMPFGEIDFVVLVPGHGLMCIEVKGGEVGCRDGIWYTRNRRTGTRHDLRRSPFKQAKEANFALRKKIQDKFGAYSDPGKIVCSSFVVLPDVDRPPPTPEFHSWEVAGVHQLRTTTISDLVRQTFSHEAERLPGARERARLATKNTLKKVRNFLRPDFDVAIARATLIRRSEERITRLTEEQYDTLELLELNQRCLIEGAAGTGKTMIALEWAKQMARSERRTQVLCFNQLLGQWISCEAEGIEPAGFVTANSYHAALRNTIMNSKWANEFRKIEQLARRDGDTENLFRVVYPFYGELAVSEEDNQIDIMIIDEAQDLVQPHILPVLDKWIKGGLDEGRWVALGDFHRQAIFSERTEDSHDLLSEYSSHYVNAPLSKNCRNTWPIGEETALLSGFEALPYRLDDPGSMEPLPVEYSYWNDRKHQRAKLIKLLEKLRSDDVDPGDIVILSPLRFEESVASEADCIEVGKLDCDSNGLDSIGFSTIRRFKGLESPVVIICDLDSLDDASLIYIGMSRARSHAILLLKDGLQNSIQELIKRKLGWAAS